jgi:hypothetical protein
MRPDLDSIWTLIVGHLTANNKNGRRSKHIAMVSNVAHLPYDLNIHVVATSASESQLGVTPEKRHWRSLSRAC